MIGALSGLLRWRRRAASQEAALASGAGPGSTSGAGPGSTSGAGPGLLFADLAAARAGLAYSDDERRRDFRTVLLGSPAGRRVLYELLSWSRLFASTFVPGDAHATHWREGGRDIGLRILAALSPEAPAAPSARGRDSEPAVPGGRP